MYRGEFNQRKLAPQNLSRTLEDGATITSPLIPWNTCGAYMSAALGVATFHIYHFVSLILSIPLLQYFMVLSISRL